MQNTLLIIIDVDGTLTDGTLLYSSEGEFLKAFSVKDGLILNALKRLSIPVLLFSGRGSKALTKRAEDLGCALLDNVIEKREMMSKYLAEKNLSLESVAYIGDDINDFPAMQLCGFKACPADAVAEIRAICNYISPFNGGHGAVRDICEYILKKDSKYSDFLALY